MGGSGAQPAGEGEQRRAAAAATGGWSGEERRSYKGSIRMDALHRPLPLPGRGCSQRSPLLGTHLPVRGPSLPSSYCPAESAARRSGPCASISLLASARDPSPSQGLPWERPRFRPEPLRRRPPCLVGETSSLCQGSRHKKECPSLTGPHLGLPWGYAAPSSASARSPFAPRALSERPPPWQTGPSLWHGGGQGSTQKSCSIR